jgi:hypothetical protein
LRQTRAEIEPNPERRDHRPRTERPHARLPLGNGTSAAFLDEDEAGRLGGAPEQRVDDDGRDPGELQCSRAPGEDHRAEQQRVQ